MLALAVAAAAVAASQPHSSTPTDLRVERLAQRDALGVDTVAPLLSWAWTVPSGAFAASTSSRGAATPPVEVHVALTAAALEDDEASGGALLWRQSVPAGGASALRYDGPPLASTTKVHWRVCPSPAAANSSGCVTASFVTGQALPHRLERPVDRRPAAPLPRHLPPRGQDDPQRRAHNHRARLL